MLKWRRPAGMVSAGLVLLAGACTRATPDGEPAPPSPVRPAWSAVALPAPAGPAGRLVLRDLVACGGRWYAVGGVAGADGTRPAAWASADARTWTSLPTLPSTYYGERNILYAAGCRDGRLTPLGAKSGGAHGNPRVSSWRQRPDGALVEVRAHFELFGGPQAVNVFRITGGPAGWLIGGNRMSGAAVWVSPDAAAFRIVEREPQLATDPRGETWAFDVVPAPGGGWLLSGSLLRPGRTDRDPLMWSSPDGSRWSRVAVPATPEHEELRRVATVGGAAVAVGPRGETFAAWRDGGGGWLAAGRFGRLAGGIPAVTGLTAAPGGLLTAVSDGSVHTLWLSADAGRAWRPVAAPAPLPAGADRDVAVAATAERTVLLADDGGGGRVWVTDGPLTRAGQGR